MKKPQKTRCKAKGCNNVYWPSNSFHVACSPSCAAKIAIAKREAKEKVERVANKKKLAGLRPASWYMEKAQAAVNSYIRARDYGKPCISTGRVLNWNKPGGAVDAGHFRGRGSAPQLRFNLWNIHAQCANDNRFPSSAVSEYRPRLIERIGLERVEALENDNAPRKFTIEYLKRIAKIFRKRARMVKRRKGI